MTDNWFSSRTTEDIGGEVLRRPSPKQAAVLFSVVIFLFIMLGFRAQHYDFYSGVLITEFGLIMLPALVFLIIAKYDLKVVLRLNRISILNIVLIFAIMLFAIPLAGIFNIANLWLVNSIFGKVIVEQPPIAENFAGLIINILVIGGSAGICEEFLFRGVIQRGFERFGASASILLAAFLFSLTHMDFQKIFGTFFLGALIGFLVYRSNSLYGGVLAHFTNNSIAVVLGYALTQLTKRMGNAGFEIPESQGDLSSVFSAFGQMPIQQLIIVAFFFGFILLVIMAIIVALIYTFIRNTRGNVEKLRISDIKKPAGHLLWALPGLALIAAIYYLEVLKFRGGSSQLTDFIRIILGI